MEMLEHPQDILDWYQNAGVDEAIGEQPLDRYALAEEALAARTEKAAMAAKAANQAKSSTPGQAPVRSVPSSGPVPVQAAATAVSPEAIKSAVSLAGAADSLDALKLALEGFDGCALKNNATNLVFGDGNRNAKIMFVGDVPGSEEDRQGLPFVGAGGQLLTKMLASIGLDRSDVYLTNGVFWRPAGNRRANSGEIGVCLPFVERIVELVDPQIIVALGESPTHALFGQRGSLSRLRAKWYTYETGKMTHPITGCGLYHPDFLIKSPAMKPQAWQDLLALKAKLAELNPT